VTPEALHSVETPARPLAGPTPLPTRERPGSAIEEGYRHDQIYRHWLAATDAVAAVAALVVCSLALGAPGLRWPAVFVPGLVVLVAKIVGLYDHDNLVLRRSTLDEVPELFQLATLFVLISWLASAALFRSRVDQVGAVVLWGSFMTLLLFGRAIARGAVRSSVAPERCMLVGRGETWEKLRVSLEPRRGAEMVSHFRLRGHEGGRFQSLSVQLHDAAPRLTAALEAHRINRVIIAVDDARVDDTLDGILLLKGLGVKVSFVPHMPELLGSAGEFEDLDGMKVLGVRSIGLSNSSALIKRALDLVVSVIGVVLLSPLLIASAIAVRLDSKGPILFRQERVGRHNKVFWMYKFRTMRDGADAERAELMHLNETDGLFKIANDPRLTRVGQFMRSISLDELPQLFNVIRGEMSLVGPRPLVIEEDRKVSGWARRRLDLTPGMTGVWQIRGSTRVPLSEMVKLDYLYVANWSLWGDLKALLRTLPHVLGRRGL
jgi:exopolysaccharide biosynthesis polyprenyl glycosylphosphotransferase